MSIPADQYIRDKALDHSRSFIVQAPAGSGKTEILTRRVLSLLCIVDVPEQILAITFTKKAAIEMRQRVVGMLERAVRGDVSDNSHESEGLVLARRVVERDKELGWGILKNTNRLNLRTIDSLASMLSRSLPVTSTLGAQTGLVENPYDLYAEASRRFIVHNMEALDDVFIHIGNDLELLQSLLCEMLSKRDQWQRYVYEAAGNSNALRSTLEAMLEDVVKSRLKKLANKAPDALEDVLIPTLAQAAIYAERVLDCSISDLPEDMQKWSVIEGLPGGDICDMDDWISISHGILTAQNQPRKRLTKNEGFPAKSAASSLGVSGDSLQTHKEMMNDCIALCCATEGFIDSLAEVRKLPYPSYNEAQWLLLSKLLDVLPLLLMELQIVFSEHSMIDYCEVAARAQLALGDIEAPTDLALSMDMGLNHILVDEFQDTSYTQFTLFEKLVAGWQVGDGRSFFAVGDPMQSIYRFREADVGLFTKVQHSGIGSVAVEPLRLTVNFRAAPVLTDWVNQTFGAIFPDEVDTGVGAVPFASSTAHKDHQGVVTIHPFVDCSHSDEARRVAEICQTTLLDKPDGEIAILVRSRTHSKEICHALRESGLPYDALDMESLSQRAVVKDIVCLCLAILFPHDRLHWAALLRAPFVGLTLNDMHALLSHSSSNARIIDILGDDMCLNRLSDDGKVRARRFMETIKPALYKADTARWVEAIWLKLGGPVVCVDNVDHDAAERALQVLYAIDFHCQTWNRKSILKAMGDIYADNSGSAKIQVMTLHKSKGLEFETVIIPALGRGSRANSKQLINWHERSDEGVSQLLIAPFEQRGIHPGQRDRINKLVAREKERGDFHEMLRLLYVSCTRAISNLHIVGAVNTCVNGESVKPPPAKSLLAPLWPIVRSDYEQSVGKIGHCQRVKSIDRTVSNGIFRRLTSDSVLPDLGGSKVPRQADPSLAVSLQWSGKLSRQKGTVLHEQLKYLAEQSVPADVLADYIDYERIVRMLRCKGMLSKDINSASKWIESVLHRTVDDPKGRWILGNHRSAVCEWELSSSISCYNDDFQRVVIDRSLIDENGVRWIIDYKSTSYSGNDIHSFIDGEYAKHKPQIDNYAKIVGSMEKSPIKAGLYWPALGQWREWSSQDSKMAAKDLYLII